MTIGWFISFFLPFVQENVANHARDLVIHVSKMSSLLKDKRSHYEIVALDLALVWISLSLSLSLFMRRILQGMSFLA